MLTTMERQPESGRNRQGGDCHLCYPSYSPGTVATRPHHPQLDTVATRPSLLHFSGQKRMPEGEAAPEVSPVPWACAPGLRAEDSGQRSTLHSCLLYFPSYHLSLRSIYGCIIFICVFFPLKQMRTVIFFLFTMRPYPLAHLIILHILNNQESLLRNKQTDGHVFLFCFGVLVLGFLFIIC